MDHATQVKLARRLLAYMDAGTTAMADTVYRNPVRAYTSPARLAREREILFARHPLLLGLSCEVARPGDFLCHDDAGAPILLLRADSGQLGALLNVCRHRGARLVDGRGALQRAFACPYHAWSYDREGRLVSIPCSEAFAGVDRASEGLTGLPVQEKYGLIWCSPRPGADFEIDAHLGGLGPELASYGFETYHHYETRVLRRRVNWKLVVDTFLETYHLPVLHRRTVSPLIHGNLATFDPFGPNLRMVAARRTLEELRDQPEDEWDLIRHAAIIYVLFPNSVFIVQGDHVETWHAYPAPDRADACTIHLSLYTPEAARTESAVRHWNANLKLALDTVDAEDFPLSETIQRGFYSGALDYVTYGRNEPSLAHFHRSLRQALLLGGRTPPADAAGPRPY